MLSRVTCEHSFATNRERNMKRNTGLWIDHKEAFIVFLSADAHGEALTKHMVSDVEKHVRFGGHSSEQGTAEDHRDRQYAGHLQTYYDDVISQLHDAPAIFIIGPGEAKGELKKRLISKGFGESIVGVETVDKLTEPQIAAKVREHFQQK